MRLRDLIDFEAQLVIDEDRTPEALRRRDRAIYRTLPPAVATDRHRLIAAWLDALRRQGQAGPLGAAVLTGHRWLTYGLVATGFAAGAGLASGLLFFDGGAPVNVGAFLLVIVGAQLALLLLLALSLVAARFVREVPVVSDVWALLRFLASRLEPAVARAAGHVSAEVRARWQVARSRLRTRASLYRPVERWVLIELTQVFGVAFNVGVLVVCLRLIYFSDLAFGWSTTADALSPEVMYGIVRSLSWPWAWAIPAAAPSYELVVQSQFSRVTGGFPAGAADFVGRWWPFMVAAVVTYGLLPRVGIWAGARALRGWALARVPLDTPDAQRVLRRLASPRIETRAERPPPPSAAPAPGTVAPVAPPRPAPRDAPPRTCLLVYWREVPADRVAVTDAVGASLGYQVGATASAGGVDVAADTASYALAADQAAPVVVLAEAWEAPDRGIRRYLRDLRGVVGPELPVYVALVGDGPEGRLVPPEEDDVSLWRDRLTLLEDPYLGVVPLEVP